MLFGKKKTKKKKNKRSSKKAESRDKDAGIKWGKVLAGILLISVGAFGVFQTGRLFASSGIFKVKNVEFVLEGGRTVLNEGKLTRLVSGTNIFSCDIKEFAQDILKGYPSCESVNVVKVFPDSITVYIQGRIATLQVRIEGNYYLVDSTGLVVEGPVSFAGRKIISVEGIEPEIAAYVGKKYPHYKLQKALEIIFALRETSVVDMLDITGINVGDIRNVIITIEGGIEVRIGNTDFKKRLMLLREASRKISLDPKKVRYVDLRFENLIIGSRQSG